MWQEDYKINGVTITMSNWNRSCGISSDPENMQFIHDHDERVFQAIEYFDLNYEEMKLVGDMKNGDHYLFDLYIRTKDITKMQTNNLRELMSDFGVVASSQFSDEKIREYAKEAMAEILPVLAARDARVERKPEIKYLRANLQKKYAETMLTLIKRDGYACASCGNVKNLTIDHVVALANGGKNNIDNLQILCQTCNSKKGAK